MVWRARDVRDGAEVAVRDSAAWANPLGAVRLRAAAAAALGDTAAWDARPSMRPPPGCAPVELRLWERLSESARRSWEAHGDPVRAAQAAEDRDLQLTAAPPQLWG